MSRNSREDSSYFNVSDGPPSPRGVLGRIGRGAVLGLVIISIAIITLGVIVWSHFNAERAGIPLDIPVVVSDDSNTIVTDRLVVLFVNGREVARTDASDRLQGGLPRSVGSIGTSLKIGEGGPPLRLAYRSGKLVTAYAFPGDYRYLTSEMSSCRGLISTSDGRFLCSEATPLSQVLVSVIFGLALIPFIAQATAAFGFGRRAPRIVRSTGIYTFSLCVAVLVSFTLHATGVVTDWVYALTDLFAQAVNFILGVFALVLMIGVVVIALSAVPRAGRRGV